MTGTSALGGVRRGHLDLLHGGPRSAPPAGHLFDVLGQHLLVLDGQVAADRVVVKGARPSRDGDVEAGEVAARCAAVAGRHGARTLVSGRWSPASGPCAIRWSPRCGRTRACTTTTAPSRTCR